MKYFCAYILCWFKKWSIYNKKFSSLRFLGIFWTKISKNIIKVKTQRIQNTNFWEVRGGTSHLVLHFEGEYRSCNCRNRKPKNALIFHSVEGSSVCEMRASQSERQCEINKTKFNQRHVLKMITLSASRSPSFSVVKPDLKWRTNVIFSSLR